MPDHAAELEALKQRQADLKAELVEERKKLKEIQQKKKRILERQIRRTQHQISTKERKRDTRRKILAGSWVLSIAENDQAAAKHLRNGLNEFLERERDRELFGLSPSPPDAAPSSSRPPDAAPSSS